MDSVLMLLGGVDGFLFSTHTAAYQRLRRASRWRWTTQDRISRPPAHQYLGPGTDEQTLSGLLLPHYKGGLGQIDRLRELARHGRPLLLVAGYPARGDILGYWYIRSTHETQSEFTAGGAPLKIDFRLTLVAYGADPPGAAPVVWEQQAG